MSVMLAWGKRSSQISRPRPRQRRAISSGLQLCQYHIYRGLYEEN